MSTNIYTHFWQSKIDDVINNFRSAPEGFVIDIADIAKLGDRKSYYSAFTIYRGMLNTPKSAHAPGRDFHSVFVNTDFYRENLSDKKLSFRITKGLSFKVDLRKEEEPDFFTDEDFQNLEKYAGVWKDANNSDHNKTYDQLKSTYEKVEFWARQVQRKCFPQGIIKLTKKPTNQASNFEYYQWARIYPGKEEFDFAQLAFTVDISVESGFTIKIDTVGIGIDNTHANRKIYLEARGDHNNSPIVVHYDY